EYGVAHEICGKVVVARAEEELPPLDELERRGRANGLQGVRRLGPEELCEHEPHVRGIAGLLVPETGIVDYKAVTRKLAQLVGDAGGSVQTSHRLLGVARRADGFVLATTRGEQVCRYLINCGGLQCDRIARLCGLKPGVQIIPFRGGYYDLIPERRHLVRNLIYPVPNPLFPFLGVHFTRAVDGEVEAGPNAVLAFAREGYRMQDVSSRDMAELLRYRGFWQLVKKYWRDGLHEMVRSVSK